MSAERAALEYIKALLSSDESEGRKLRHIDGAVNNVLTFRNEIRDEEDK